MLQLLPVCAFAGSSVINMSRYDMMRPNFSAMKDERIVGMIHEATYPRYERDAKYYQRQMAATEVGFGATFSAATLNDENKKRADIHEIKDTSHDSIPLANFLKSFHV